MRYLIYSMLCIMLIVSMTACEDAVLDVNPPIDSIEDELLNDEAQIPFLVKGLQAKFGQTYGTLSAFAGGLSDELVFDRSYPGATFPQYNEMESGQITLTNNSVANGIAILGQLRLLADTLVTRVENITFTDEAMRGYALYNAYLYGAIARYFWASYFGLEPEQGGGVINAGPFIPSAQMYADAISLLNMAVQNAPSAYDAQLASSLIARIHAHEGRYAEADAAAQAGLAEGDAPLAALFNTEAPNFWHFSAGAGRTQFVVAQRFIDYLNADPAEAARIPLAQISATHFRQDKYPEAGSPLPFITWQEMALIRAEAALQAGQSTEALDFVNSIRQAHGIDVLNDIDLDVLFIEREKEMFCMGIRLLDQRRTDSWHLADGTWKYLPITQRERDGNDNF